VVKIGNLSNYEFDFKELSEINKPVHGTYEYHRRRIDKILGYQYKLKNYGNKYFKLVVLKTDIDYNRIDRENIVNNEDKLENNLIRAKNRVFELAMCNEWDWFVTLTLDPQKYDRNDLKRYHKDLTQFVRDQRKRKGVDYKFLFVPEQHQDGTWHMHGLLKGICERDMPKFTWQDGVKADLVKDGYHNWIPYAKKFGFVSLGKVKNAVAVSKYCSKYINKALLESQMEIGAHTYYASRGLADCGESISLSPAVVQEVIRMRSLYESDFCDLYEIPAEQANELLLSYLDETQF